MLALQQPSNRFVPPVDERPYYTLKSRQEEISNQLENVTERREDLAQELSRGRLSTIDREGIEQRIKGLDQRILQLETDLATVGKELAVAAPASLTVPEPRVIHRGFGEEDMVGAGFIGASIMFAMFIPLMIRSFRRRRWMPAGSTGQIPAIGAERIDRMEQSIESIAVEIERVSENQRFMTRLMTETQLAGTIAAVRGSAEAAKVAVEKSPHA
jgi:K+/H+ antiporter YhaU regulatory subunit KhtT